ncbi:Transcriptional regulator containing HTH domain ArsR family [Methanonatronarchaeum thermophilum]|uniref:Transcriptional regulator containing HTH domain ArsR family n=1 Tax=Methanonatronarchaeum thermophilum TaxID=1927129 RepID=A0A1Y3GDR1_9EURY|nr:helix-turn-helix domain-containing protein [Methanonatronarchaeum thermophilum]OUJ18344.1 Transcriptional regulator containing HTH domain ArsR family [Methanonatronarchaeum thermophilum]
MDPIKVVRALGSKYSVEILSEAQEPKPVKEIVDEVGVPIATGYRRIQELEEADLIEVDGKTVSEDGGDIKLYRSRIKVAKIDFDGGLELEFVENEKGADKLVDIWDELK